MTLLRMFGQPASSQAEVEALVTALERRVAEERGYAEAARDQRDRARYLKQAAEAGMLLKEARDRLERLRR